MLEINQRLDGPQDYYNSPSSIAEVDEYSSSAEKPAKRRKLSCAGCLQKEEDNQAQVVQPPSPLQPGDDDVLTSQDGRSDLGTASDADDINVDVALEIGSSVVRKRRFRQLVNEDGGEHQECVLVESRELPSSSSSLSSSSSSSPSSSTQPESVEAGSASQDVSTIRGETCDVIAAARADIDCGNDDDLECSPVPSRCSRRTLYIEYWSRTDECKERKWDHLDEIAEKYGAAEDHIFDTTLRGRTACLEPNMFPYDTPAGIEHWTLWHVKELNHEQIKQYVENWIDANAPHVVRWNYDDNPERSIDIFHVHVYLQVADGSSVLQGRKFEDLMHEMD